jgi:hypothetical protein
MLTLNRRSWVSLLTTVFVAASPSLGAQGRSSWTPVEQTLGRTGAMQPGDVIKFSFPRRDLHVTVGDVQVKPSFALGSWVAFERMANGQAMVMGDLVLTNDEIAPVMSALQRGGVEQTALHALARALGYSGKVNGGVYQVSVARAEQIMEDGMSVPPSMGTATSLNFQPTGGGKAAITGDFVMIGSEVNPVIRVLRDGGIGIAALHSHMIGETPRLYFMHFWANDDAVKLAGVLHTALSRTNSVKPASP